MIRVRGGSPISRKDLAIALDEAKIGNRMLFGGNLVRQPVFSALRRESTPLRIRVVGDLPGADATMSESLFVGTYPGLDAPRLGYIAGVIAACLRQNRP